MRRRRSLFGIIVKVQDDADVLVLDMWHGLDTGYMQIHTAACLRG